MLALCLALSGAWGCIPFPSGFAYDLDTHTARWDGAAPRHVDRLVYDLHGTVSLDDPLIFRAGFE